MSDHFSDYFTKQTDSSQTPFSESQTFSRSQEPSVIIGPIPSSETNLHNQVISYAEQLRTIIAHLDPRNHINSETPYDPIDLAFRIADAIHHINELRQQMLDYSHISELTPGHYQTVSDIT